MTFPILRTRKLDLQRGEPVSESGAQTQGSGMLFPLTSFLHLLSNAPPTGPAFTRDSGRWGGIPREGAVSP